MTTSPVKASRTKRAASSVQDLALELARTQVNLSLWIRLLHFVLFGIKCVDNVTKSTALIEP